MKIPLPGRSVAFGAPTGSNAAQNTGVVKDLEACKKRTVLSYQALNLLVQIRLLVLPWQASHCDITMHGITFTSNGLWGHNPTCPGFDTPDTPPERRDEHEEKNP